VEIRKTYFLRVRRRNQIFKVGTIEESSSINEITLSSNHRPDALTANHRAWKEPGTAGSRSNRLIRPLSMIEKVIRRINRTTILSIGPRTEGEILNLIGHGFNRDYIRAVDLMSYSPWIELGDIHALPYKDSQFDVVLCGWVLTYSRNIGQATSEILRVVRNGGVICIGLRSNTGLGLTNTADVLAYFNGKVDRIYFDQDGSDMEFETDEPRYISVIFTINKSGVSQPWTKDRLPSQPEKI